MNKLDNKKMMNKLDNKKMMMILIKFKKFHKNQKNPISKIF